jgi:AraC-like DNA-binding protein
MNYARWFVRRDIRPALRWRGDRGRASRCPRLGSIDISRDLSMLAGVAGLSAHRFARLFKQSAGVTPHVCLTQKRVERAHEM